MLYYKYTGMSNRIEVFMESNEKKRERVILAGVHRGLRDKLLDTTAESMLELGGLVKTAGGIVVGELVQNRSEIETASYMGEGKINELKTAADALDADTVVFDDELSPVQTRNLTDYLGIKVLDRSTLILDIFAMRAKSGEGKLQAELAQLRYRLPRLRGTGVQMSRTGAGIGTRGPGETRLESDRRHIRRRIAVLEEEIRELKQHRELIRERRKKDGIITAALVGYTNAGKSTLLNTLTDAGVSAEDKLFATLDPTSRSITLGDNRKILLVDTVGFIRKLPHHLIEAFKSTLEEAVVADVLLHVIDLSSGETDNQIEAVERVLGDIGAVGKPVVAVFNKCDMVKEKPPVTVNADSRVFISAVNGTNIDGLIDAIAKAAPGRKKHVRAILPYSEGALVSALHETQKVISEEYSGNGTVMELLVDAEMYGRIREYVEK